MLYLPFEGLIQFSGRSRVFLNQRGPNLHRGANYMSNIHAQLLIRYGARLSHYFFTISSIALCKATHHWLYFEICSVFKHTSKTLIENKKYQSNRPIFNSIVSEWYKKKTTDRTGALQGSITFNWLRSYYNHTIIDIMTILSSSFGG